MPQQLFSRIVGPRPFRKVLGTYLVSDPKMIRWVLGSGLFDKEDPKLRGPVRSLLGPEGLIGLSDDTAPMVRTEMCPHFRIDSERIRSVVEETIRDLPAETVDAARIGTLVAFRVVSHLFFHDQLPIGLLERFQTAMRLMNRLMAANLIGLPTWWVGEGRFHQLCGEIQQTLKELPSPIPKSQRATMFVAGVDTTASAVAFFLYELARCPGSFLPGYDVEEAIDRTLKRHCPIWFLSRVASRTSMFETSMTERVQIPKGSLVLLNLQEAAHRGLSIPFGYGPRFCLGAGIAEGVMRAVYDCLVENGLTVWETPQADWSHTGLAVTKPRKGLIRVNRYLPLQKTSRSTK